MKYKKIGIDFDNTIVKYDSVFFDVARSQNLIDESCPKNKTAIRNAIRLKKDGNKRWTELQGFVYTKKMEQARLAVGFEGFIDKCINSNVQIFVISHKTQYPVIGEKIDMRESALEYMIKEGFFDRFKISKKNIIFVDTMDQKVEGINSIGCEVFIDDLIEFLEKDSFCENVQKILYSNSDLENINHNIICCKTWNDISEYIFK